MKLTIDPEIAFRVLTVNEAIDLINPHLEGKKKRIHTMDNSFGFMMGCDVDLTDIKKRLKQCTEAEIFISDVVSGHGVVFKDPKYDKWLFLATDDTKWKAIIKQRKIKSIK